MAVSSGDVLRIVAKMSREGNDIQNVFHCQVTGTGFGTNVDVLTDIADDLDVAYDFIDGLMADNISFDTIEGYNLTQDEYLGEIAWPALNIGTNAGNELPQQTSPLVLFSTDVLRSQGRKFLPPFVSATLDTDGTLVSGPLANIASWAATVLAGVDEGTWTAVFGNYRPVGEIFIEWTASVVRDFFATQRRRYLGSGS